MKIKNVYIAVFTILFLTNCGTHRSVVKPSYPQGAASTTSSASLKQQQMQFIQKVSDGALYQKNLVSDLTFTVNTGKKDITVPGILRMRKDEVIRLQLLVPIIRSEVGRIEFTKDYVLFLDRIHKQYVKAKYTDVAFLKNNGINFYSLQSLFWNQLFIPGQQRVGERNLAQFNVDFNAPQTASQKGVSITLNGGKINYKWIAEPATSFIREAEAKYSSAEHGVSTLNWDYENFKKFGSKMFPYYHKVTIKTPLARGQKIVTATFEFDKLGDNADWESFTTPSPKYEQVSVEDILGKLMQL